MRPAVILALLAAVVLAACGGSSSHSKSTSAAAGPTKAQFVAQADPICAAAKRRAPTKRLLALIGQFPTPTQEIVRLLRRTTPVVKDAVRQLSAVPPPAADRAAIARWISQIAAIGVLTGKAADQLAGGDLAAAVKTYTDITANAIDPVDFAKGYGLHACSSIVG
ncbi:MAG: hypothetical protein QOF77_2150 [Solirubrobacteraceae bacterium]|jgi:hypothetical protein|nr:hypothetical protein [Solirubrobacteraceae bacterium]